MNATVNISFEDFNHGTRRSTDTRRHETAQLRRDIEGGWYVMGALGCGRTRAEIVDAVKDYLGGRRLICHNTSI